MFFLNLLFSIYLSFSFRDSVNLIPIADASVYLRRQKKQYFSDEKGKIKVSISFPETLVISHVSYRRKIFVVNDLSDTIILLSPLEYRLEEQVVKARKYSFKNEFTLGKYTISRKILKLMLKGREEDIFFSLLSLPEVDIQTDYSARFSVMGGSPGENLFYIDEIKLRSPFHLGEIFSFLDPSMVKSFEFYPAIVPAEYNDAVSSVTSIETGGEEGNLIKIGGISSKYYLGWKERNLEIYNLARIGYIGQILELFGYNKFNYSLLEEIGKFVYREKNFLLPVSWIYSKDSYLTENKKSSLNKRDFGLSFGVKRIGRFFIFSNFLSFSNFYLSKFSPYPFSYSFKNEIQTLSFKSEVSFFKGKVDHKVGVKSEFEKYYIFLLTPSWGRYITTSFFKIIPYYSLKYKYRKFLFQSSVNFQTDRNSSESGYLPVISFYQIPMYNPPSYGFYITPYNFNRDLIDILSIPMEKDGREEFFPNLNLTLKYLPLEYLSFESGIAYLHQNAILILPFEDNYRLSNYWFSNFKDWEPIECVNFLTGIHILTDLFEIKFYPYYRYFFNVLVSSTNPDPDNIAETLFRKRRGMSLGGILNLMFYPYSQLSLNLSLKGGESLFFTEKDTIFSPWNAEKALKTDMLYRVTDKATIRISYYWADGFYYFPPVAFYDEYSWNPADEIPERRDEILMYDEKYQKKFPVYSRWDLTASYRFHCRFFKNSEVEISVYNLFNRKNVYFYYYTFEGDKVKKNTSYMMPFFISFNLKFTY